MFLMFIRMLKNGTFFIVSFFFFSKVETIIYLNYGNFRGRAPGAPPIKSATVFPSPAVISWSPL
jgi:hypothetical protein